MKKYSRTNRELNRESYTISNRESHDYTNRESHYCTKDNFTLLLLEHLTENPTSILIENYKITNRESKFPIDTQQIHYYNDENYSNRELHATSSTFKEMFPGSTLSENYSNRES